MVRFKSFLMMIEEKSVDKEYEGGGQASAEISLGAAMILITSMPGWKGPNVL